MKKWMYLVTAGSMMSALAFAQTEEPVMVEEEAVVVTEPDSHAQAVEEMLVTMRMNENVNKTIDQMMNMQARMGAEGSAVAEATREFYEKYLNWDAQKADIIEIYKESFTEDEIREMTAFYQTTVGQKVIQLMPELSAKSMKVTMERMGAHMKELREAIAAARVKDGLPADGRPQLGPYPPEGGRPMGQPRIGPHSRPAGMPGPRPMPLPDGADEAPAAE
ncbi:MAG: DUF2059 domain-containing protein [Verrucomicrobiae bacterium]|nr:DUF2059 domain-containing protein [Verrucomicrobiae bacterium]